MFKQCGSVAYSMPTRYTVVCSDTRSRKVEQLARENEITEEEVLRQLIDIGLSEVDEHNQF